MSAKAANFRNSQRKRRKKKEISVISKKKEISGISRSLLNFVWRVIQAQIPPLNQCSW
jgi:hypothetical protein